MNPLGLLVGYVLLTRGGGGGGDGGEGTLWRQLAPNSKGQYAVPAGALFAVDIVASSPVAPLLAKQLADLGGEVFPPNKAVTAMPIAWPLTDETRSQTGRMRGVATAKAALAVDMGVAPTPTRVWVK